MPLGAQAYRISSWANKCTDHVFDGNAVDLSGGGVTQGIHDSTNFYLSFIAVLLCASSQGCQLACEIGCCNRRYPARAATIATIDLCLGLPMYGALDSGILVVCIQQFSL
ncbi:hypothetical protein Q31a_24880 [Aureliella helgolandensis]|uniref:Uncharacterized protein n=1 Tax=Aureliella helgolandensis TaxID=2527968 RepID=A0A518G6H6_9BACT|nr:hypothetical protein Q31a_24880 [Aureliella helgolandensis]